MSIIKQLKAAIDEIEGCLHADTFYATTAAIDVAAAAMIVAAKAGCDVPNTVPTTALEALSLIGRLLAFAEGIKGNGTTDLTPPQVAKRLGVNDSKVRGWINKGFLRAVNTVDPGGQRPRWKISEEELASFRLRRAAVPLPKSARPRHPHPEQPAGFVDFFPDHAG